MPTGENSDAQDGYESPAESTAGRGCPGAPQKISQRRVPYHGVDGGGVRRVLDLPEVVNADGPRVR